MGRGWEGHTTYEGWEGDGMTMQAEGWEGDAWEAWLVQCMCSVSGVSSCRFFLMHLI